MPLLLDEFLKISPIYFEFLTLETPLTEAFLLFALF